VKASSNGFSYKSYQQLQNIRPFKTVEDTKHRFFERDQANIAFLTNQTRVFTRALRIMVFIGLITCQGTT
jgi:hypothetical protein